MAVSTVGVADATSPDKYLHTHQRTISSTAREDQYVQQGESAYPTYSAGAYNISTATTAAHVLQVMGDGSNYSRLKRITVYPHNSGANALLAIDLYRLSSAGTGGSAVTPAPFDTADTYGGGAMTLPSSKGTEAARLHRFLLTLDNSVDVANGPVIWEARYDMKPIVFGTATSNGIAFKVDSGSASSTVDLVVEFTTTSYL